MILQNATLTINTYIEILALNCDWFLNYVQFQSFLVFYNFVSDLKMEFVNFSWVDYTLFALMFGLSGVIGIYFGCFGKQQTAKDYLLGGKKMKVFPVAMSLVASTLSGITLLGIPAEIYMHGTQYWMMAVSIIFMSIVMNYIYLPVFYELQLTNCFEYLELRFHKNLRTIASSLFTFTFLIYLPVVIYAPSLAFNQVTGFDLHIIAPIMSLICVFYTTIGGLKAVVWTDTLQFSVTLCTLFCVLVMGTITVGGLASVWETAELGQRIEFFNMNPDPTARATFWSVFVGNFFIWTSFLATNPATVQRFLAVPTLKDSKRVLLIYTIFTVITKSISCFSGLIIYAKYHDCDPLTAGLMQKADQILPYYVLDVATQIPGLSGLFVAGLFSTALSTLSTYINSLSGILYTDFISPFMSADTSEKKASNIMKLITVVIGLISVSLVFVVEKLGSVLELMLSLSGITGGPMIGLFTLGVLFPFVNRKGATCGIIGSIAFMFLVVVKNQIHVWNHNIRHIPKPLHTHGCNLTSAVNETYFSTTTILSTDDEHEKPFWLYRISFYYYMFMGTLITFIIALPVSWFTASITDPPVNPSLLSPCVRRFVPQSTMTIRYTSVEKFPHGVGEKENIKDDTNPLK